MTMTLSQGLVDVVASVRCSCPILVLLRWDVEMLSLILRLMWSRMEMPSMPEIVMMPSLILLMFVTLP